MYDHLTAFPTLSQPSVEPDVPEIRRSFFNNLGELIEDAQFLLSLDEDQPFEEQLPSFLPVVSVLRDLLEGHLEG